MYFDLSQSTGCRPLLYAVFHSRHRNAVYLNTRFTINIYCKIVKYKKLHKTLKTTNTLSKI